MTNGNTFTCVLLHEITNAKTYLKFLQVYLCVGEEKKLCKKLKETTEAVAAAWEEAKKLHKVSKNESKESKAEQELEVTAAKLRRNEAKVKRCTAVGHCYDLFCQLLKNKPQVQWDHITAEVHTKVEAVLIKNYASLEKYEKKFHMFFL